MTTRILKNLTLKKSAGTDVWFGPTPDELPNKKLDEFKSNIFASYSGPDLGLSFAHQLEIAKTNADKTNEKSGSNREAACVVVVVEKNSKSDDEEKCASVAGAVRWNLKNRKAYGICMSLYDQHPVNGKISGDPVADSFGLCARENSAVLIVADGVNWGEKPRLAARCATYGCMEYVNRRLFGADDAAKAITTTGEAFDLLLSSLDAAHDTILRHDGGLTTLCIALVCPLGDSKQFAVCIVNVGDSLAFVFSRRHGVREITTGSHDIRAERDIRDAGGALGPVNGCDPELHNLTCSMTFVDPGDVVFLTTDGISDNFDPVVTKIAVAKVQKRKTSADDDDDAGVPSSPGGEGADDDKASDEGESQDGRPVMAPHERHQYAVKEMERIIHEFELFTESPCSAQELSGALLQHVLKLTDPKRKVLENPRLYGRKLKAKDRECRDREIVAKLSKSPGKLDHATVIGYEVGCYHGNEDEEYCVEEEDEEIVEMDVSHKNQNGQLSMTAGHGDLGFTENHFL